MQPYFEAAGIRIFHGDVREIVPTLGLRFDLAIADPPYQQTSLPWDTWPSGWPSIVADATSSLWCFGSFRMFTERWSEFAPWALSQDLVWEKHNGSAFHTDRFRRVHDQMVHFYRGPWAGIYKATPHTHDATARSVRRKSRPAHMGQIGTSSYDSHDGGPRQMRSVIYARSMHGDAENETQKPEGVVAPLIEYGCPQGGLLLSAFSGSGTDLVVARLMGIRAIGIEVREDQCEKAARRLSRTLPLEMVV